jgi:hypothetical protein
MVSEHWQCLSFFQPGGGAEAFRGLAVVRGRDMDEAISRAWALGINPGVAVRARPIDPQGVPEEARERLLSREDLDRYGIRTRRVAAIPEAWN